MKYKVNLKTKKADIYIPSDEQYDSTLLRALDRQGLDVTVNYIHSATTSYRYDIVNMGTAMETLSTFSSTGCIVKDPSPSRYIGGIDEI